MRKAGLAANAGPSSARRPDTQGIAGKLIDLVKTRRFSDLIALERSFTLKPDNDAYFFLAQFARMLGMGSFAAFTEAAAAFDALRGRFGPGLDWIEPLAGKRGGTRLITDASAALTRTGRYPEARALLDDAIRRSDPTPALLQHRAKMCWPYDLDQARRDLGECCDKGAAPPPLILFRAYLEMRAKTIAGEGFALDPAWGGYDELDLVAAAAALDGGRFGEYRDRLNAFFRRQGVLAPLPAAAGAFDFASLATSPERDPTGPLVSVIMTTFNSAQTVRYAVASILGQTHSNLELLVVDDRSSDATPDILEELRAADLRIRVLRNARNVGTYLSKNRAMELASGAYLTFHDSDDWAHPERVARHARAMEEHPALVASRSDWLRVADDGGVRFRRWGKKFKHGNPASAFVRREVIDAIGYFDGVRFGADSEYWLRVEHRFGRSRVKSLELPLGLGRFHKNSLTQSGDGAMDEENYSPVRGAYAAGYMVWQATADAHALKLPARPAGRPFPAPPEMFDADVPPREAQAGTRPPHASPAGPARSAARAGPGARPAPEFVFAVALAARSAGADWTRTVELLGHTLRSALNQTDNRFTVAVGGHERPDLPELDDPRVRFLRCDVPPPAGAGGWGKDKMRKRRLVAAALRAQGGGYLFALDPGDLVHRDVTAHALAENNRNGYLIDRGYALDDANRILAPVPGVWGVPFDRVCGSCAAIFFRPDELPSSGDPDPRLYFDRFHGHAYWPLVAEEAGRGLAAFPFAGGVRVVDRPPDPSTRQGVRPGPDGVMAAIARHGLDAPWETLGRDFGWREAELDTRLRA